MILTALWTLACWIISRFIGHCFGHYFKAKQDQDRAVQVPLKTRVIDDIARLECVYLKKPKIPKYNETDDPNKTLFEEIVRRLNSEWTTGLCISGRPGSGKSTSIVDAVNKARESNNKIRAVYIQLKEKNPVAAIGEAFGGIDLHVTLIGNLEIMKDVAKGLKEADKRLVLIIDDTQEILKLDPATARDMIYRLRSLIEQDLADVLLIFSEESEVSTFNAGIVL